MEQPPERAGAAIVRAWVEPGRSHGLRVRVTEIVDLDRGDSRVNPVVTSVEELCAILGRWLTELVEAAGRTEPEGGSDDAAAPR